MKHVADGILHAYLDGALDALAAAGALPDGATSADVRAHFDACADCRARLDEARGVKERAGEILDDAGVYVADVPPFSEIANRSNASAPVRRRGSWLPLTWAATVLLALGAGWWGSALLRSEQAPLASADPVRLEPSSEAASASEAMPATPASQSAPSPLAGSPTPAASAAEGSGAAAANAADAAIVSSLAPAPAAPYSGLAAFRERLISASAADAAWQRVPAGDVDTLRSVFVVADGGPATVDVLPPSVGWEPLVRVRQRLAAGDEVEMVIGGPQAVALDGIVVTGMADAALQNATSLADRALDQNRARGPARSREAAVGAAAEAKPAPRVPVHVELVSAGVLDGGRAEVVVRVAGTDTYATIRGDRSPDELAQLAARLVRPGR